MTRENIINRQKEITKEISNLDIVNCSKNSKTWKKFKSLCIENSNLQRELDKLDGKTYNSKKWIKEYIGESYNSLKEARYDLINQIKDLPGVEVGNDKTGVVGVTVYTEYKIYHYIIHAHYRVEVIGTHEEKGLFGLHTVEDTRQIYQAYIEYNGQWEWRY